MKRKTSQTFALYAAVGMAAAAGVYHKAPQKLFDPDNSVIKAVAAYRCENNIPLSDGYQPRSSVGCYLSTVIDLKDQYDRSSRFMALLLLMASGVGAAASIGARVHEYRAARNEQEAAPA